MLAAVILLAAVLAGGYFFNRNGQKPEPETKPAQPTPNPDDPENIDDIFEEVSKQILDTQKR